MGSDGRKRRRLRAARLPGILSTASMTISVAAFIVSLNFPGATSTTVINALVQVFAALMVFMFVALMSALVLPMLFELVPMLFELVIAAHKMWLFARDRLRFRPRARHSPQSDPDALDVALARGREQLSRAARLLDPTLREATLETALDRLQRHAHTPKEVRRLARRFSLGMLRAAFCQWLPRLVNAALGGGAVGLGLMGGLKSLFDIQPPPLIVILTMVGTTILSVAVTVQETLRRSRK